MKYAVVIPARYKSSRFPGKPLAKILGKPMIQRVWEQCCKAVDSEKVYVATDSHEISRVVKEFGGQVVMTSSDCLTGTDRLAEANKTLDCDFLVNVQGDEPVIDPKNIDTVISLYQETGNITNAYCEITSEDEFRSFTVPKVVVSELGKLLYMSRSPIPLSKNDEFIKSYKQVCVYAFGRSDLEFFSSIKRKTPLETIEDIEILRFLESGYEVSMIEVPSGSLAVDIPEDVHKVEEYIKS
ncbi:3-deoxy-manno-octulosonate cytidylyltransferase [Marinomonas piezotolerans]|uniref:3-deoxy-manno-octulosonate cytidylyltransferase n=1 Tax=Marinomonas piezotolerans TaxID=2213058 RepID=A0A370U8K0_9GAMM|nr:3-deoxy-manno-octulosonate cytidylyltransferase [Marinomonas piezotolerans]RDL44058.1 3-deoxy-manno-octulosonate cytidylyltransferase [Marinomonas piezotolerans]